jgi:hypothetical protein
MNVSKKQAVDGLGRDRKGRPVTLEKSPFLIEAAVDEQPGIIGFQEIAGARDLLVGTQELNSQLAVFPEYNRDSQFINFSSSQSIFTRKVLTGSGGWSR